MLRPRHRPFTVPLLGLLALVALASPAAAHTGGIDGVTVESQVSMPGWVVWFTGAMVVAISFAIVGAFLSKPQASGTTTMPAREDAPAPAPRAVRLAGGALGLLVLATVAVLAVRPENASVLPEAAFWLLVWAGLPILAYTVGNAWEVVSPFRALAPLAERLRGTRAPRAYPEPLGAWPSVLLLLGIVGLEVSPTLGHDPTFLARALLAYAAFTFVGMTVFGADAWLTRAEALTRTFRWWNACAFLRWTGRGFRFRSPAEGLRNLRVHGFGDVAFTVVLLYGVNFDAFLNTGGGQAIVDALRGPLGATGAHVGLLALGYLAFLGAFWVCARAIRWYAESLTPTPVLAARFAASLLPIAVAYHFAHNAFYVYGAAPTLLLAARDPLGAGWNLLPGVSVPGSLAVPAALVPVVGVFQMLVLITGHVIAVIVAHDLAFKGFTSRVQAIRSELPLTAVMVFYTFIGLWLVTAGHHAPGGI